MRKVKNITVCVTPEIYREARHLAAEYDTTVSAFVAWLLPRLRIAVQRTCFPDGRPKRSAPPAPARNVLVTPPTPPPPPPPTPLQTISGCETVPANLTHEDSAACSQSAAPVQPLCSCKSSVTYT